MTEKAQFPFKKAPKTWGFLPFHSWDLHLSLSDVQKIQELGLNSLGFSWLHMQSLLSNDEVRAQRTPDNTLHPWRKQSVVHLICFTSLLSLWYLWDTSVEQSDFGEQLLFSFCGWKPPSWKRRKICLKQEIFQKKKKKKSLLYILLSSAAFLR